MAKASGGRRPGGVKGASRALAPSGARRRPPERPKRPAKLPRGRWLGDFEPLSEAERLLVTNCARGEPTGLGEERPEDATEDNRIRADLIRFLALGGDEWHPVHESGINLLGAWIGGELSLEACKVDFPLTLIRCQFTGDIILWDAHLDQLNLGGCHIPALRADRLTVEGGIFLRNGFQADGEVRLSGAMIGGHLDCSGGRFQNPEGFALSVDGFRSKGDVFLHNGFQANGEVRLIGAKIGGSLNCSGGRFDNTDGSAISADRLEASGSIFLDENFHAVGEVRLIGAQINGNLRCSRGRFEKRGGNALSMDGFIAKGSIHFTQNFQANGEVRLIGATIGGNLACSGGKFENPDGDALSADRLDAKGSIFFNTGFHAIGSVRLLGASIGGNIGCSGGRFENPGGDALIADRCKVKGSLFLNTGFDASGTVRLVGARIGGDINCQDGNLKKPEGMAFGGDRAIITGALFFRNANISGQISLASCQVGTLIDDSRCWPDGSLILDGFQYSQISGPTDARHRIAWLKNQEPQFLSDEFCPQPWEQIIKVLREMGHNWNANQIAIEKQRALYEAGKIGNRVPREGFSPKWGKLLKPRFWLDRRWNRFSNSLTRLAHRLYGLFSGYGYRPSRIVWSLMLLCALSSLAYYEGRHDGLIGPTSPVIQSEARYAICGDGGQASREYWTQCTAMPSAYTTFQPLFYSLDLILPLVDLQQERDWAPIVTSQTGETLWGGRALRWLVWFEILFGWVMSLMFVAIVGRLVEKD